MNKSIQSGNATKCQLIEKPMFKKLDGQITIDEYNDFCSKLDQQQKEAEKLSIVLFGKSNNATI